MCKLGTTTNLQQHIREGLRWKSEGGPYRRQQRGRHWRSVHLCGRACLQQCALQLTCMLLGCQCHDTDAACLTTAAQPVWMHLLAFLNRESALVQFYVLATLPAEAVSSAPITAVSAAHVKDT